MGVECRHNVGEDKVEITVKIAGWIERPIALIVLLYRRIRYGYAFRRIRLTRGKYAIVDDEDYYRLGRYKWYAHKTRSKYYAVRRRKEHPRSVLMHREIIKVEEGFFVDHINHNGLDNRRANLRPATPAQNNYNRRIVFKNKTSKYKGVRRHRSKWQANIFKGKKIYIGSFDNEDEAARAYNEKAKELFGEYARPNVISDIKHKTPNKRPKTEDGGQRAENTKYEIRISKYEANSKFKYQII